MFSKNLSRKADASPLMFYQRALDHWCMCLGAC